MTNHPDDGYEECRRCKSRNLKMVQASISTNMKDDTTIRFKLVCGLCFVTTVVWIAQKEDGVERSEGVHG